MFPGPGFFELVISEGIDVTDQNPGAAAGSQAHVDVVGFPRPCMGGKDVNYPLAEAVKKLGAVDGFSASPGGFMGSGVQKNKIEIRTVSEFQSPQFAVGDDSKSLAAALIAQSTDGSTVFGYQMIPGQFNHLTENALGNF